MQQYLLILWFGLAFWATGQIWLAQVTIYPLFGKVGQHEYIDYHSFYTRSIPVVVILPGFATFLMPIALALLVRDVSPVLHASNIAAGIVGLLVTIGLEIPRHNKLETRGKNDATISQLIRYNWPRTASITAQAVISVLMLLHAWRLS